MASWIVRQIKMNLKIQENNFKPLIALAGSNKETHENIMEDYSSEILSPLGINFVETCLIQVTRTDPSAEAD